MMFDRMRVYDAGHFHDVDLPDWYHEANRLSETECIDWHRAFERVLDCEYTLLTEEGQLSAGLEIRFWQSETNGTLVLIETPLGLVEQVVILNPTDWLPFLSTYLAPLMASSAHFASATMLARIGNALIARARHGDGSHIDRETGESRIDLDTDWKRRRAERLRAAAEQRCEGGPA
jgi:hypothetical protein